MFTEVSFPGVPGARADARWCSYQRSPALADLRAHDSWVSPYTRRWSGSG